MATTAFCHPAQAAQPSGSTVKVTKITIAEGPGGDRVLETSADVYSGDEITTNADGLAQIEFIDNTRIVVGPSSKLVLDSFVFNPDKTAQKVAVSAVKGVFRFITGHSPHEAYSIKMPTMTIGVRGTSLDGRAAGDESYVVFHEGSGVGQTPGSSQTIPLDGGCRLYRAPAGGSIETTGRLQEQRVFFAYFQSLIGDQSQLAPQFRVPTRDCTRVDRRLFGAPVPNRSSRGQELNRPPSPVENISDSQGGGYNG